MNQFSLLFIILGFLSLALLGIALISGSVFVPIDEVWESLMGDSPSNINRIILELRLPRALSAFAVGGLLAVTGVLMQVLLRNPLAEPYILGSSGGAAAAALLCMLMGLSSFWIDTGAFTGAMLATLLVFGIAKSTGNWEPTKLLLTGIVLAAGFSAIITLILALSPEKNLKGMLFWMMGDLSFAYAPQNLLYLLVSISIITTAGSRYLDVLSRGELQATILGMSVPIIRFIIFFITALATAMCVTAVGVIGFIGLVVPHMIRLITGNRHKILIPASVLAGGSLLITADTIARTIIAPRQLPVGAITAVIGVPLFLFLLSRNNK